MRRILAMLLAIVMLVGNVPIQAFATDTEPQETTPCPVEGCTYGAGHSGECSTFVACTVEGCTFALDHEGNCSNYVAPEEPKAEPAADAAVYVTVSDRGELGMAYEEVTVSDINADGKLTVDEALYAAHTVYGKGYTSQEGTVTQLWGVETTNASFFVNHKVISLDVNAETVSDGDYLVASVDQDAVNDYDKYSRFDVLETSVKAGAAFSLTLTDDAGNALAGMEIGLWGGNGSTTMTGLTTDVNGAVTLTLDQEGMYCVTAKGTVVESSIDVNTMEITSIETPIVVPVCVVTVSGTTEQESVIWSGDQDRRSVENENLSAEVAVTISDDQGNLVLVRENVTAVDTDGDGILTFHDAMVVVHDNHNKAYKIRETEDTAVVDMLWDKTAGASLFFINDRPLGSGVNIDTIQTGDTLYAAFLRDTNNYSDWYTFFTEDAVTVEAGEEFTLTLQGFSGMAYGEITPVPLERMAVGLPAYGFDMGKTDENGQVALRFDEKGTYTVSADGTVLAADWEGNERECLIVPPVCIVTVTEPSVAVDKVTLDQNALNMTVGDSTQLNVEVGPENATDKTVTWKTSNASVATADGGLVIAIGAGTATITATAGNESAECIVTVSTPEVESGGITIETGQVAEYMIDQLISKIVLQGVSGTASGSKNNWEVVLDEETDPGQKIVFEMTSSIFNASSKSSRYFWVNGVYSEKTVADADPGTVTIQPEWENGQTTLTIGVGTDKKITGEKYTLDMSIKGQVKDDPNTIKLEETKSKEYFAKSFIVSESAVVSAVSVSDTDYTNNTQNHKATINVTLAEMPTEPFNLTMNMMEADSVYVSVNGGTREELDGSYTTSIDLGKGTSYVLVTYSSKTNNTVRGTYTIKFSVEGMDTNMAPTLKDNSKSDETASLYVGQTYTLDLAPLFTDGNGDDLKYTVQIGDAEAVAADANYSFPAKEEGKYILVFRANDGKADSEDCYTVYLDVRSNTAPELAGESAGTATVDQYSTWKIDLGQIFTDKEGNGVTYTVSVNGGNPVNASQEYSYTPETADEVRLVFQAQDDSGAVSPEYTLTLHVNSVFKTVIETNCSKAVHNYDSWLGTIEIYGAEVVSYKWNVESGHTETEEHVLLVQLKEGTPDDAKLSLIYTEKRNTNSVGGSVNGPDSVTLENGMGSVTVVSSPIKDSWGVVRTYTLNFTNKSNTAPTAASASGEVSLTTGDELKIDLTTIFSDADGDELRYTVAVDGGEETAVESQFSQTISTSGEHILVFKAYDNWDAAATYTVTVTASQSEKTYEASFLIPEGITPSFYVTGNFDGENGDTLGDALTATAGATANGFSTYTVAVPETVSRISFRGSDTDNNAWGGMSVAVSADMEPVTVIQLNAVIPSKVNGSYVTADQALFQIVDKDGYYAVSGGAGTDDYGIVNYRFLIVAWGTDDLAKAYTAYVQPQGDLTSNYATSIGSNKTFEKDQPQQLTTLDITPKSSFTINAPAGATVQAFQQTRYYNSPEIPVTSKLEKEDGTVDWVFPKGSQASMTYRASMPGKITKAGYVNGDRLNVSWDDNDASPNCRDAYDTSKLYGARGDDSLMLNVNSRNNLVLNSGDSFRLRAYRIWEIINSDTQNVMIQPDMTYTLSGDNILTVTPVTSGNGNGKNNWLDIRATGSGVAYLEVSYDAMQILTGNMSGFGGDEIGGFVFNACDENRTGLVVMQVGNAAADVDFGIRCTSKINSKDVPWDAEFDTLYFTGNSGQLSLSPSVVSGSIAEVAVSGNKGASWTALTASDGVYTADIVSGNNILRITKTDGTQAYQVVRGDKVTVTITGGDGDNIVEAGESYRIQLHGLHNPIGKMAGNYNPGYQAGQHVSYKFNDTTVTTTANYQYDFVSNAWVDVTIPKDAQKGTEFQLNGGNIFFNIMGIGDVDDDTKNHRSLTDDGCTTRASGGSNHQRSILPEITLTVGRYTDGSAVVEEITLDQQTLTLTVGDTAELKATVKPADTEISWSSSDVSVATVFNGSVTANKAGTATITVTTSNGETATCKVTVTAAEPEVPELDIELDGEIGHVIVSFVDDGVRLASDLNGMEEPYKTPLGTIVAETKVPFKAYDTVAAVTLRLLDALNMTASYSGNENSGFYLSSIGNFTVGETTYTHFGEFDAGSGSGWMVTQNDVFINKGASEFYVKEGDEIKWQYTCQLGADIGDTYSKAAVEAVEKLIDEIGDVTLDREEVVKAAREAYDKLAPVQKAAVSNYQTLTAAEAALAALKANEADKEAAKQVVNLIEAIDDEVTQESKAAIEAARDAYDALTDAQKALVTNYHELEAAEEILNLLERVDADIANIYTTTGNYLAGKDLGTGSTNGEWAALGLARSGRSVPASYYDAVHAFVEDAKGKIGNGRLHDVKSTENSRLILALTAIGKDVTDVNGYNLLSGLNEMSYITKQGINGAIYALIALDSHDYTPVGVTRNDLITAILDTQTQIGDGGWSLSNVSEVDLTAMAIQALTPYYSSNTSVKAAVDKALTWLSNAQNQDGSFSTGDGANAESIAQVIVALTALGIDPDTDSRFIKNGITPVQALAQFYVEGGGFEHIANTGRDDMATEQGYYALAAYARFKAGQTALYDMSDVTLETTAANQAAANNVIGLINAIGTVDLTKEDEIEAAREAYDALTQKDLVTNYKTLTDAETALAQLQQTAADNVAADVVKALIDSIGTVTSTGQADEIETARRAYNALTTLQKNLVGAAYLNKLEDAEDALAALEKAEADEAAAQRVENLINAIGSNITVNSETAIKTARNAYNALDADQKARVSNYQILLNAETAFNLLKSTVSVTFELKGCYKHGTGETTVHTLAGGNLQTWIAAKTYRVQPGATVKDLFEQALTAAGLTWKNPTSNYVESITRNGVTIGEFTNGTKSGWMYTLNGKHPGLGVNQQTLVNGDKVVFHYSDDYTKEEGSNSGSGTTNSGSSTSGATNYITTTTTTVNTETAESVDRLIEDIGEEITLESEAKILAARAAYDKLTEAQKKLVEKYDILVEAEAKLAELKGSSSEDVYITTGDYIQGLGTPGVGAIGGEWMVIGLARSGRSVPSGYYDHVLNYVRENINDAQQLHSAKSSDNSRLILALTAIGKDVTNVDGHDLLKGLNDMDYIQKQGINGPIWALLAFDSGNYPVPEGDVSRAALIDVILEAQLDDGGWALSGERSDPDMTGMAIQALVPYMESNMDVKKAVEEAIWTLSEMQNDNGSFSSVDGPNSESIAQVITALAALGIDADTDARFVKNGISALDALLTYYIPGGGFRHVLDGNLDGMSTEQAYYALVAYNRMKQGQNFLYDMTDVIDRGGDVIVEETTQPTEAPTEPVEEEENAGNDVVIWTGVMTLCAAAIAVILLNRKKLFGKFQ